jgi:hypothetical protein
MFGEKRSLTVKEAVNEAAEYLEKMAYEKDYGDICITLTMYEGEPVKLNTAFCEHLIRRRKINLVVEK